MNEKRTLKVGNTKLPPSPWLTIDQEMIDRFGAASLDPDPMHIDPSWARLHGPFGDTMAFGFQTLSLLTHLSREVLAEAGLASHFDHKQGHALNYGFDRVRFLAPVRVGRRIRAVLEFVEPSTWHAAGQRFELDVKIEIEGEDRPALAARWIWIWVQHRAQETKGNDHACE